MHNDLPFQLLSDIVLMLHFAIVVFVVGGLVFIIIGNLGTWRWVNAFWFRLAHLSTIMFVVAEAWLGATCPLTILEMWLRERAFATTYSGSFIEYWIQRFLYYEAPPWVFMLGYTLFGMLVVATWLIFPPTIKPHDNKKSIFPKRSQ